MVQVRFGSGSMLNSIAKSVRSLGVWVPHLFIFANYVTVLQRIFFFLLTLQIRKAGAVSRIFSHFFHSSFVGLHELNVKEGIKEFWNTGEMTEKKSGWQSSMQSKTRRKKPECERGRDGKRTNEINARNKSLLKGSTIHVYLPLIIMIANQ